MGFKTMHRHKGIIVFDVGTGTGKLQVMASLHRHVDIPVRIQYVHRTDFCESVLFRHTVIPFCRVPGRGKPVSIHKGSLGILHKFCHQHGVKVLLPFRPEGNFNGYLAFFLLSQGFVNLHQTFCRNVFCIIHNGGVFIFCKETQRLSVYSRFNIFHGSRCFCRLCRNGLRRFTLFTV